MKLLTPSLITSTVVALIGFAFAPVSVYFLSSSQYPDAKVFALNANIWCAWLWIITFLVAVYTERWRSLWLLLVAPLALAWPIFVLVLGRSAIPTAAARWMANGQ